MCTCVIYDMWMVWCVYVCVYGMTYICEMRGGSCLFMRYVYGVVSCVWYRIRVYRECSLGTCVLWYVVCICMIYVYVVCSCSETVCT